MDKNEKHDLPNSICVYRRNSGTRRCARGEAAQVLAAPRASRGEANPMRSRTRMWSLDQGTLDNGTLASRPRTRVRPTSKAQARVSPMPLDLQCCRYLRAHATRCARCSHHDPLRHILGTSRRNPGSGPFATPNTPGEARSHVSRSSHGRHIMPPEVRNTQNVHLESGCLLQPFGARRAPSE